ncbi:glycoside hydrolase [Sphingomonas sp. Leaf17]|uniref:glycosyltransferase n=1 Tax=Sphingomonas sp. Leaf17 TaxID=1735683 RepID=UPI0006F9020D|nr:glycosyltransferase [Sphingomonas sp. Leaf17]KQM67941.1 glycoside hydrolase [Sphingomonas sp. Leaf17]
MLRVLTLSSLFPDATRRNFGVFVEQQTVGLAARDDVALTVVAPVGLPPFPFDRRGRHARLAALPLVEDWKGVTVHRPRFRAWPLTAGRWYAAALARAVTPVLDGLAAGEGFDVIDASFFFPDGVAAAALGRRYGVPVSIKARGADIHHWGTAPATAHQVRAAGRAADGLLAVSAAMRDDMIALGLPGDRIRVHHTGVDHDRFVAGDRAAQKAALGVTGPLVLSLGALIPRKGHDIVMTAIATLPGVTLVIAGTGPDRAALETLAVGLGVAERVRFLGDVAHAALPAIIGAADVMALASASEGLANAWVEALACGTPIVITDAGGAREVVRSPATGRVAMRDPIAFAAAIADLLADPPATDAVRAGAAGFTWEANRDSLFDHLSGLVAGYSAEPVQAIG